MKRMVALLSPLLLLVLAELAPAAVFPRDWKTPGDGLLTYDDVNQREWLDVPVSQLSQFPEPRLQNALAQISPGGLFEGFTWASREDVLALARSGGIDVSTDSLVVNRIPTTQIIELLGPTRISLESVGLTSDSQINPPYSPSAGAAFIVHINPSTGGGYAGCFVHLPDDVLRPSSNGLMLYRVVPEPVFTHQLVIASWPFLWRWKRGEGETKGETKGVRNEC